MKTKLLIIILSLLLGFTNAQAKWWIFGGGEDEVGFDYLYANTLSFDDISSGVAMLPISSLDKGDLHVRGKARSGANQVGAITISLDGAKTWQKASFEKDGGFDFSFTPDTTQSYDIYVKVIDTTGKSNEIEDAHVKISFSNLDAQATIEETLNKLKNYYEQEDDNSFMLYVSDAFEGDAMTLERALRKDFSALDNIKIDFSISGIAFSNNRYYASVYFNRSVDVAADGSSKSDRGVTEFSFDIGEKGAMLLSMKNPLIFGLTYAADIASGTTASAQNSANFITINDSGSVTESSLANIESGSDTSDFASSGSATLSDNIPPPSQGFNFFDEATTTNIGQIQIYKESNSIWGENGALVKCLNTTGTFSGITVTSGGFSSQTNLPCDNNPGDVIAVSLPNNTYGIIKIISSAPNGPANIDYKYNPGGSRTFN